MIRTLATALLALSLTASATFATSLYDDLAETGGLWYEKFTDVPFTGKVDEGLKRGAIKNGKREGPWVAYWENGRLWYKGVLKNGKREGPWVAYWDNGQLQSKGAFKNGEKESGKLPSGDPAPRAKAAEIQIAGLSPTVPRQPRRRLQHPQYPAPSDLPTKSPDPARPG